MLSDIVLDHVAIAAENMTDLFPRYGGDLGARWIGGGATIGFDSAQISFANAMKVEMLEPYAVEQNDFLRRFLDRNGAGPHHLTFKVKDLKSALVAVEAAGYRPVGVDLSSPWWKEAFLHPKDAPGVVVQLAESLEGGDWGQTTPIGFPEPRVTEPATLVHVAHAVADLDEGRRLFVDLLGGKEAMTADGLVDLTWPGPGRIRLVTPDADATLTAWLDGRRGRVHHLAFECAQPDKIAAAEPIGNGVYEIPPEQNFGVRLLLCERPSGFVPAAVG